MCGPSWLANRHMLKGQSSKKSDAHCWCLQPAWQGVAYQRSSTSSHTHTIKNMPVAQYKNDTSYIHNQYTCALFAFSHIVTFKLHILNYYRINEATTCHLIHFTAPSPVSAKHTYAS